MLTFFTTAKPFAGHDGIIQRNALKSWTLLDACAEVVLFGDDDGAAAVAQELGLRHEPETKKNEFGSNRMDYLFSRAQEIARHDVLCYSNCDILLLPDFSLAVEQVRARFPRFLMIGRRWDTEITKPIDFSARAWREGVRAQAVTANDRRDEWWIDYFVFSRGLFRSDFPALAVGRPYWDNYTVWKALDLEAVVVDASAAVMAVHQNHGYTQHPQGREGIWQSDESRRNFALAGGWAQLRNIEDATVRLKDGQLERNPRQYWRRIARGSASVRSRCWFLLLGLTRPLRRLLGLRSENVRRWHARLQLLPGKHK